jgi:hypothetical protein
LIVTIGDLFKPKSGNFQTNDSNKRFRFSLDFIISYVALI